MNLRSFILLVSISFSVISLNAQGPHDRLIEITQRKAADIASSLRLNDDIAIRFSTVYVNEALAVEDLIVNAEPEVAIINRIHELEQIRINQVKNMLDDASYQLYKYILEEEEAKQESRFDSLQIYLNNEELQESTMAYFDDNVVPYLIYYHQTFFRPALKQKHYWKINQSRQSLYDYEAMKVDEKAGNVSTIQLDEALANLDKGILSLKRIRKRYKDELDYITVALGPMDRIWSDDYIGLVKEQFADDVYLRIRDYSHSMNAYGMDYLLGELSMVLFDVWKPRTYIESRQSLSELFRENLR